MAIAFTGIIIEIIAVAYSVFSDGIPCVEAEKR